MPVINALIAVLCWMGASYYAFDNNPAMAFAYGGLGFAYFGFAFA